MWGASVAPLIAVLTSKLACWVTWWQWCCNYRWNNIYM